MLLVLLLIAGCGARGRGWSGPARRAAVSMEPWVTREAPASILRSPRYAIYTTLPSGRGRNVLPQVLEGAYARYQALAPAPSFDARPMHGYVFADRAEWEQFTSRKTGDDARVYREIPRGGYTIDDWFAIYADSDPAVFSAAAHEGWHQYAARHFKGQLPPFLDEGIACLFENVRMDHGLPRWNPSINPARAQALGEAANRRELWPLGELITLHAGDVVDLPPAKIDAFYAQNWAFARFLLEAEGNRYRPMLRALLADAVAGTLFSPADAPRSARRKWNPDDTRAVLEHYLGQDLQSIERSYAAFCRQITGRGSQPG